MSRYPAQEFVAECFRHERTGVLRRSKKLLRRRRVIFGPFRFGIETNHPCFIDRIGKIIQGVCRLRRQRFAIEEHGLVLRKKMQVINQRNESVIADFRVGRISVFHVDLTFRQRGVAESVIDSENLSGRELITLTQWSPAVAAVEKFVGQPKF